MRKTIILSLSPTTVTGLADERYTLMDDNTQWPITNWHFWFGSYVNTKYFWVVFYSDSFFVPMYNLAGHIVNFIYFNKSSKWGSRYFGKNFRFSDIITFLPFFNEKQIHFFFTLLSMQACFICILSFLRNKRSNTIWIL